MSGELYIWLYWNVSQKTVSGQDSVVSDQWPVVVANTASVVTHRPLQGPIFERWNTAKRSGEPAAGMTDFWGFLMGYVRSEQAWLAKVFPRDETLLPKLLCEALDSLRPQVETLLLALAEAPPAPLGADAAADTPAGGDFPIFYVGERAVSCAATVGSLLVGVDAGLVQAPRRPQ